MHNGAKLSGRTFRLHLIPRFGKGGAEQTITNIAHLINDTTAMIGSAGGEGVTELKKARVRCVHIPMFPSTVSNFIRSIVAILRIMQRNQVSLIHVHHRFSALVGHAVRRLTNVSVVNTVHDLAGGHRFATKLGFGHFVTVFSQAVYTHLSEELGLNQDRIYRIPMGIVMPERISLAEVGEMRSRFGCGVDDPLVGFCGRLVSEKAPDLVLKAAKQVLERTPNARFWMIGDGEMRLALEAMARELKISEAVRFFGWRNDPNLLIGCVDVVVVPSLLEGFGKSALESLALGKPVIATRVGGLPELIRDRENGLLIPPGSASAIADAINNLLSNKQLSSNLSRAALQSVKGKFGLEAMKNGFAAVYRKAETLQSGKALSP